jgi:hypothetical protein
MSVFNKTLSTKTGKKPDLTMDHSLTTINVSSIRELKSRGGHQMRKAVAVGKLSRSSCLVCVLGELS